MATDKQRIPFIDILKGLCITLIVLLHIAPEFYSPRLNAVMQSFRVPMYYFLSGLFFKTYDGFFTFLRRKVNNIIVPFAFFLVLGAITNFLMEYTLHGRSLPLTRAVLPEYPIYANIVIWFLPSLFEVNLMAYLCHRAGRLWGTLLALGITALGLSMAYQELQLPWFLDISCMALPFFGLGMAVTRLGLLNRTLPLPWVGLGSVPAALCVAFFAKKIDLLGRVIPQPIFFYGVPFVSILALYFLLGHVKRPIQPISYWGRYSIIVLGTHLPLRYIIRDIQQYYTGIHLPDMTIFLAIMLLELPVIALMVRFLPRWCAQEDFFDRRWRPHFF